MGTEELWRNDRGQVRMAIIAPEGSVGGVVDYLALAVGFSIGIVILAPLASDIQSRLAKTGGSA